ncbi:hypothetical protein RhiirA1_478366 [Rhizophagus irregularis]|uniref:Uncharacterized protein n=1 Tax=Rhizophagus irregularis TaxID=588596 RepID=A0A2N0QS62_9GLOM|nr:hypothetical protein RhiirA1_478366 [Rhizophagus irregularis]
MEIMNNELRCDCGNFYSFASFSQQYCKNCLSEYIKKMTNFNAYLDIYDENGKHLHIQKRMIENFYFK